MGGLTNFFHLDGWKKLGSQILSFGWMDGRNWGHKFFHLDGWEGLGVTNSSIWMDGRKWGSQISFVWMDGRNWGSQILSFGWMVEIGGHKFFHLDGW